MSGHGLGPNLSFQADGSITHQLQEWLRHLKQLVAEAFFAADRAQGSAGAAANSLGQIQKLVNITKVSPNSWTPTISFATPGDLSVAYSNQVGKVIKIGQVVFLEFYIVTTTFTHTTASSFLEIQGLPYPVISGGVESWSGTLGFSGITKTNYTQFNSFTVTGGSVLRFRASGEAVPISDVQSADVPTGGNVYLIGSIVYLTNPNL